VSLFFFYIDVAVGWWEVGYEFQAFPVVERPPVQYLSSTWLALWLPRTSLAGKAAFQSPSKTENLAM
jgi:hypothetical protein